MFVYKENSDLMKRDIRGRNRRDEGGVIGNGSDTSNININSLSSEVESETRHVNEKETKEYHSQTKQTTTSSDRNNSNNLTKGLFPSYDVKIVGGKKIIIYHDQQLTTTTRKS